MKTEKKSSEATCVTTTTVVKEEPDAEVTVKIKEESATVGNCNNDNTPRDETTECQRESNLDPNHPDTAMSQENRNGANNQPILGSVKQENEPNHPGDDLPSGKNNQCR